MNILVCDDSQVMRRINSNILREYGIPEQCIYQADSGAEAISVTNLHDIDLFLIDWNMPEVDGLELVAAVRKMDRHKTTPIIMVTAESGRYNVVEAIKAGVTSYVIKPVKPAVLWEKIQPHLPEQHQGVVGA